MDPVRFLMDLVEVFDVLMLKLKLMNWFGCLGSAYELNPLEKSYTDPDSINVRHYPWRFLMFDIWKSRVYCEMLVYETLTPKSEEMV